MRINLLIIIVISLIFNIETYSQDGCGFTIEILYERGKTKINGKSQCSLSKSWEDLGQVGGRKLFFLEFKAYLKDANNLSDDTCDRWNKMVIKNTSKFIVGLNFKWENQNSSGRAYIKPGQTYSFESYFDKPYATAYIDKVTFKFNEEQYKKFGTYESRFIKCEETEEKIVKGLLENQNFWKGKSNMDKSKQANSTFWKGFDKTELVKTSKDDDFWSDQKKKLKEESFTENVNTYEGNQFIGEVNSKTKNITIICEDHGTEDGDRVSLSNNNKIIYSDIYLTNSPKQYSIKLSWGINRIDFKALNQGTKGSNTARFKVLDDSGKTITSKTWNILTGFTGTLLITKF